MKMKTFIKSSMWLVAAGLLTACASEDTQQKDETKQSETKYVATFTGHQPNSNSSAKSRTTATHTIGNPAQVFWEPTDKIWIKADNNTFYQSSTAKFYPVTPIDRSTATFVPYSGLYTKPNTEIRYTNSYLTTPNTVVIQNLQKQPSPNDFSHLGSAGDCGTATATGSNGSYKFTLQHKASYLCFLPRCTNAALNPNIKLTKIMVEADKPIAGSYDFSDGTLMGKTPTHDSKIITLETSSGGNNGFLLNTTADIAMNGAYMVIAPGTYNLTISYTLFDPNTFSYAVIAKKLTDFTCPEGQIKDITADITPVTNVPEAKYYMWDAKQHYWYGHLNSDGTPDGNYPKSKAADPERWYNDYYPGKNIRNDAQTELFKTLPNANELAWYVMKGDPHWEQPRNYTRVSGGHIYTVNIGGLWLRKKRAIVAYLKANEGYPASFTENDLKEGYKTSASAAPVDYRVIAHGFMVSAIPRGTPANKEDYFYLPALGQYSNGQLNNYGGNYGIGFYWSSSGYSDGAVRAYQLTFHSYAVFANSQVSLMGQIAVPFE